MKHMIQIFTCSCLMIVLVSCTTEHNIGPDQKSGAIDLAKGLGAIQSITDGCNVVAMTIRNNASDGNKYDTDQQWVYCFDRSGSPIAPASASVNSQSLITTVGVQSGNTTLAWNGAPHVWSIVGTGSVPTYSDTIVSLMRFNISQPSTKIDTIRKSSGLTVSWTSPGAIDSVGIVLEYNTALSRIADTSAPTAPWRVAVATDNDGSYTFTSNQLNSMPIKGFVEVYVVAARTASKMANGVVCRTSVLTASRAMCPARQ